MSIGHEIIVISISFKAKLHDGRPQHQRFGFERLLGLLLASRISPAVGHFPGGHVELIMRVVVLAGVFLIAFVEDELIDVFIMVPHVCLSLLCKERTRSQLLYLRIAFHFEGAIHGL